MSTAFLPHDYEAPRTAGSYMKIQDGENRIRILSSPVLGWEEWVDRRPVRYRYEDKPDSWYDPARPGKHFWAFIVWNYAEERIQILQVTQASVRRDLEKLSKDSDWGAPFFYDVKIHRSGKDLKTKYQVTPLPRKPVADHVVEAFNENRCNLDALFSGDDPYGPWEEYTDGVFSESEAPKEDCISSAQLKELRELIGDDDDYRVKVKKNVSQMFGISDLSEIPASKFDAILKSVKLHAKERLEKEMAPKESVPF